MREPGFYWVMWSENWEIVYWSYAAEKWCDGEYERDDSYWDEIDERRIVRSKGDA